MTTLARYTPRTNDLFSQMRKEMDDLLAHWFDPGMGATLTSIHEIAAPCELKETEAEFVVRCDVPGMTEKDLKITFQGDTLTISGERREEKTETKGVTRYTERTFGSFSRTLQMPSAVKAEDIRARYKDGVMEVHLPKSQKTTSREVKIEHAP